MGWLRPPSSGRPSSTLLLFRESTERCEINGYEIHAKSKFLVNVWAIARDPKYWTKPESFKRRNSLIALLTLRGIILNISRLELEGGYAQAIHLP